MTGGRILPAGARASSAWALVALIALVAFGTFAGCKRAPAGAGTGLAPLPSGALPVAATALPTASPLPAPLPGASAPQSFADLAAKADPAVVFVKTLQERRGASGRRRVVGQGVGSAFVYDPNGLIITNNHVIEEASEIRVIFGRKREVKATIVGRDPRTDIAVLRVEEKNLPYLPLGDSNALRVGDWVVAIGNPFALSHTVSAGILSAKGRTISDVKGLDESGYYDFLQTDASINPGNSGGPLLDTAGNVVGINTAIRANSNNIGFAIPINMVKELLPRVLKDGHIKRSAIGVHVSSVLPDDLERLKLSDENGALVRVIVPGGPADRAGLQIDDVIQAFEGEALTGPERLRWVASLAGVGKPVTLRVVRGGRTFDLKLTLVELPDEPGASPDDGP
ncbi:MAG TPA: trypsin-like peptidase domain-containing protein [Polyangiaceae bacterium]|nr:trypsin-like peptidase domain-containing protein [Polyangiaceae bacterium]